MIGTDRKIHKFKKCLDCPAIIPSMGGKSRCSPCSDTHTQLRIKGYAAKRWQKRKAAQQEAHG